MRQVCVALCLVPAALLAQAPTLNPVVNPRGVVNSFTLQPAPSPVAPGGLVTITGLNLGPATPLTADVPWTTKLGDVEVLVNGRAAAVGYVSPGKVVAQVPWNTGAGLAQVVVRRGEVQSRAARFQILNLVPSVKTADESGFGEVAVSGTTISLSGLGVPETRVADGETGTGAPRNDFRAYIGGLPAGSAPTLSSTRVGEWELTLNPPDGVQDGDPVVVASGGRSSNPATWRKRSAPVVEYVPLPEGTPEIRVLQTTDLRASLLTATAARGTDGCFKTWLFDTAAKTSSVLDNCLAAPAAQAVTPIQAATDSSSFAALIGPPAGQAPNPVSSKVKVFSAAKPEAFVVELPAAATALTSNGAGNYVAVMGTSGNLEIDPETGETRPLAAPGGGAGVGGGAGGGLNPANLSVDLGDGIKVVLAVPIQVQAGVFAVVVGDDADNPTKAKMALLNAQGRVQGSLDFPAGWVPLVPPPAPVPTGPGGAPLPGNAAALAAIRVSSYYDAQSRLYVVLGRKPDDSKHAVLNFAVNGEAVTSRVSELPEGWFAVTCTPRVPLLTLDLSRRLAFFGDRSSANAVKTPCSGQGFISVDLTNNQVTAIPLQGAGLLNAAAGTDEMNDFVFATNIDPSRNNRSDTVFVLDGVSGTSYRFDAPANVQAIGALTPVPEMNLLVTTAAGRTAADGGLLVLDLEKVESKLLPIPDGFNAVQLLGVYQANRKLIARGNKADGSSLLIYDLVSGDLLMPPNPPGVAFFGPPVVQATPGGPGQGGQGGGGAVPQVQVQGLRAVEKSSAVAAIGYNAGRQQVGIVVVRVP